MEPQRRKQDEPAKQERPESIGTKKPLENHREKINQTNTKRDRERQKRKAKEVNQKFIIIDNDLCGSSSLSALRKLDVPIIAHLWNHKEENKQNLQNKEDQKA